VNYHYRRWAAADAVLRIVRRDQPHAIQQLRIRVGRVLGFGEGTTLNDETTGAVAAWCDELHLGCEAIRFEALALALVVEAEDQPASDGLAPDDDLDTPYYRIPWIPGESKRRFVTRAVAEFDRKKNAEVDSGGIVAPDRINPKHVEWFVQFQVHGVPYDRIAKAESADRQDVKRAIRDLALLLQLKLRPAPPGRPKGRGGRPKRSAFQIVRRRRRP
jgi:hypothetical protein